MINFIQVSSTDLVIRREDEREDDDEADEGGSRVREAEGGEQLLSVHEQAEHHEAHERVHLWGKINSYSY